MQLPSSRPVLITLLTTLSLTSLLWAVRKRAYSKFGHESISRLAIIGDVHGCADELQLMLSKLDDRQVVFVGDLVGKGPQSSRVLQIAQSIHALTVRGNHDQYAIEDEKNRLGLSAGELKYLSNAPYFLRFPSLNLLVVHAGFVPNAPANETSPEDMMTMRNVVDGRPTSSGKEGIAWAEAWQGPEHVVFGHDAKRKLQVHNFATGLDTGCVYGGKLTALLLPENKLVTVDALNTYKPPGGGGGKKDDD